MKLISEKLYNITHYSLKMKTEKKVFERNGQIYTAIRRKGQSQGALFWWSGTTVDTVRIELLEGEDRGIEIITESVNGFLRWKFEILRGVEVLQSFAFGSDWMQTVQGGMGDYGNGGLELFHIVNE